MERRGPGRSHRPSRTLFDVGWTFGSFLMQKPAGYGLNLFGVYAVWLCVVVALYPPCRWFAALKRERPKESSECEDA